MNDDKFYGDCIDGSIRMRVAEQLMDSIPALSKLKGAAYYDAEDAICSFIRDNEELIFRHVDRKYMQQDVAEFLASRKLKCSDEHLEQIALVYEDTLSNSDMRSDAEQACIHSAIKCYREYVPGCITDVKEGDANE